MYLFSNAQIISRGRIIIPYEMRAALGYHEGCLVGISQSVNESALLQNQILVSSIPHAKRQDLWNLRACVRDRPGILTELTDFLTKFNLDIWDCYVATREQNSEFVVDLSLDAQFYESNLDLDSAGRKQLPRAWLREMYARIACNFIEDLALRPDGKPNLYLKRNHPLSRSVEKINSRETSEITSGSILLPTNIVASIFHSFEIAYGIEWSESLAKKRKPPYGMLVADPEFRSLTITVLYPDTGHVHIRVEANNRVGTIAALTKDLFDCGFNILQAYTRNLHASERSLTDLLLHLPPSRDKLRDDGKLKNFVRAIFRGSSLRSLDCQLSFPSPTKGDGKPASPTHLRSDNGVRGNL
jgi:glycine cleavage system regulatory protein